MKHTSRWCWVLPSVPKCNFGLCCNLPCLRFIVTLLPLSWFDWCYWYKIGSFKYIYRKKNLSCVCSESPKRHGESRFPSSCLQTTSLINSFPVRKDAKCEAKTSPSWKLLPLNPRPFSSLMSPHTFSLSQTLRKHTDCFSCHLFQPLCIVCAIMCQCGIKTYAHQRRISVDLIWIQPLTTTS